jgi:tetratricopeptide (TPR) repeat protein
VTRRRLAAAVATVALVHALAPTPARAQEPAPAEAVPDVRAIVERAQRHFDLGEYEEAIAGFREAYRLDPRPGLLFNLGQAYRLHGDCVTAALMYRNFLRLAPGSKHRALAEQHLAAIATCEQEQLAANARPHELEGHGGGDGGGVGNGNGDGDGGGGGDGGGDGGGGGVGNGNGDGDGNGDGVGVSASLVSPAPAPSSRARTLRLAGIATAATGGVALLVGGYFSLDAARAADDVSQAYRDGAAWAEIERIDARGRRAETLGAALLVTGGVAVAAGAALYALGWRSERAAVVPAPGGGEVVVTWAF